MRLARLLSDPRDRGGQRHGARRATSPRSRVLRRRRLGARRAPGAGRASAASCTPARRSPGSTCAGRCRARSSARSLYEGWADDAGRGARALAARGDDRVRALPPPRRGRADGGDHQPVDAGVDRGERRRTATAPSATSTRASARCCASAPTAPRCSTACAGWHATLAPVLQAGRARCSASVELQAAHGAGAAHGRRGAQPQRRRLRAAAQAPGRRRCSTSNASPADVARARSSSSPATTTSSSTSRWRPARRCSTPRTASPTARMVTAMARNGVELRHPRERHRRRAGSRRRADPVDGLYFPGYSVADAAPDLGDSAITETAGVGGFAMAAAPAIVKFVGGTPEDAIANSRRMRHITLRTQRRLHAAGARLRRHAVRHRRAPRGRHRHPAGHQHRHRAPRGRRRPDRRRHHARAARLLHRRRSPRSPPRCGTSGAAEPIAVVAIGGNALIRDAEHESIPDQYETVRCRRRPASSSCSSGGWNVVVTPRQRAAGRLHPAPLGARRIAEVPPVPMDYAGADIQGAVGYMFVKALAQRVPPPRHRPRARRAGHADARRPRRPGVRQPDQADRLAHGRGARARARRSSSAGPCARTPGAAGGASCPRRARSAIVEIEAIRAARSATATSSSPAAAAASR